MKKIKFKKPIAIDIDGIARAYVVGDVRDYLSDDVCEGLVKSGSAEYVLTEAEAKAEAEAEKEKLIAEQEKVKAEAELLAKLEEEQAELEKKRLDTKKENKLHNPKNKENKSV